MAKSLLTNALPFVARDLLDGIGCAGHCLTDITQEQLVARLDFLAISSGLPTYITGPNLNFSDDKQQAYLCSLGGKSYWRR